MLTIIRSIPSPWLFSCVCKSRSSYKLSVYSLIAKERKFTHPCCQAYAVQSNFCILHARIKCAFFEIQNNDHIIAVHFSQDKLSGPPEGNKAPVLHLVSTMQLRNHQNGSKLNCDIVSTL